jgi:glycosyltransferase involved in cell wall biosynthesis
MVDPLNYTPYYDLNLCSALIEQGWKVECFTSPYLFEHVEPPPNVPVRNVFLRFVGPLIGRVQWLRRTRRIRSAIKAVCYPFDLLRLDRELASRPAGILHVQWALLPVIDVAFWKRWQRHGWQIVYTAHDVDGLDGTTPRMLVGSGRRLFQSADAIAAHSDRDRDRIITFGANPSRVTRTPQGTPGFFQAPRMSREAAQRELGLDRDRPTVLFFGLLKAYKDLETLLLAMLGVRETVPDILLLIAGEALDGRARYLRLIQSLDLGDNVIWKSSYVPSNRVGMHFAASDVVALPYKAASSSAVLLNAFAHALPVVATTVGGFPEMVENGKTGFVVPPENPARLAEALVALLRSPDEAREMGQRARDYAVQHHGWPLIGRITGGIYNSLGPVSSTA